VNHTYSDYTVNGGGDNSKKLMREFLNTGCADDLGPLDIEPEDEHSWARPYESAFSIPDGNPKYTVTKASIAVEDWIDVQKHAHSSETDEGFRLDATEKTIEQVKEDIQAGTTEDIPTPVLEISYDGTISYDEGRSRGLGAREAGADRMPIWIVTRDYR
jgi:hypothetical protein